MYNWIHPVSHLFPMHGCKGSVWFWRHWQGRAAEPFRTESSSNKFERIQPENLATVSHALKRHPATETSDWWEIRRNEKKERLTDEAKHWYFIHIPFLLLLLMDYCCRKLQTDGKLRSFKKIRCPSVGRRSGNRHSASVLCQIHGRGFYHPTGCKVSAPHCGSPEVCGGLLLNVRTLPYR